MVCMFVLANVLVVKLLKYEELYTVCKILAYIKNCYIDAPNVKPWAGWLDGLPM
jgi:hypothetical protein